MDSKWNDKSADDILNDISQMVEAVRKTPMIPAPIEIVLTPNNWEYYRSVGVIPDHLSSWEDIENWVDNLADTGGDHAD